MKSSVYILQLNNGQFYIGSSGNVSRRLSEHQSGRTKSVVHKRPVKLVFEQEFENEKLARQVEYKLKRLKSRKIISDIIDSRRIDIVLLFGGKRINALGG